MKPILILGSGAREAIIKKKLTTQQKNLDVDIISNLDDFTDSDYQKYQYLVVGSEKYLNRDYPIPRVGSKEGSILEWSKIYTRNLVNKVNSYFNPEYQINPKLLEKSPEQPFVIKPDGLTGGKGVKIYPDHFTSFGEAQEYIQQLQKDKVDYLIEERLVGHEFSLMVFSDGKSIKPMPIVMDYKRAYKQDLGANTGSMGSITDNQLPFFLSEEEYQIVLEFIEHIVNETHFQGILYGSFMKLTGTTTPKSNIKLIEFNCRFGDPEAINVLTLLKTSLHEIFQAILGQTLDKINIEWNQMATVVYYLVPEEYPDYSHHTGDKPTLIARPDDSPTISYYLGNLEKTKISYWSFEVGKSRSVAYCFTAPTLEEAVREGRKTINQWFLEGYFSHLRYRDDIGQKYLELKSKDKYSQIAGIDTELVNQTLSNNKKTLTNTYTQESQAKDDFGAFSGSYLLENHRLLASTDGVGSKILLLQELYGHQGFKIAGNDLVNHNVDDILVDGGKPLFFLDYFGCHQFIPDEFSAFISGITEACQNHNIPCLGGETAIIKDIYKPSAVDLTGTIVGKKVFDFPKPQLFEAGDYLIGIPSNGFHTNGFSLIRKEYDPRMEPGVKIPHRSYYQLIEDISNHVGEHKPVIKGLSHITGGGFYDNLKRIIKLPYSFELDLDNWEFPEYYQPFFEKKDENGNPKYTKESLINIFNCGYGLVIIASPKDLEVIQHYEPRAKVLGRLEIMNN